MEWIVEKTKYKQEYPSDDGIEVVYIDGVKCTCPVCGYETGDQGLEFRYCPMCGRKLNESHAPSEDAQRRCETCYFHNNDTDQCSNEDSPYDFTLKLFRCNEWCTLEQKMDK